MRYALLAAVAALAQALACTFAQAQTEAQPRKLTLASTTSTEQSGLFTHLLPIFKRATGIDVRVVAVGTGQALTLAQRGDADAVLVHDRFGEDKLIADGHGIDRRDVMFNDFVIVGPSRDVASVRGLQDACEAFRRIASANAQFASRGDDSGTHRMELSLWKAAGIEPRSASSASWYRELGSGMGPTLNTAAGLPAYTLTDRATWAAFRNPGQLTMLVSGDARLFNPYGSIRVNPAKGTHIKTDEARIWHDWLTGPPGQAAIASFRINGEQLFFTSSSLPRGFSG